MLSPVIAAIALLALACTASAANVTSRQVNFDIKAQPLASALIEFSKQTQLQVMSHGVDLTQRQTAGVVGRRTIAQALSQLLTNTNLGYAATAPNTIAIITADSNAASVTGADSGNAHALRLAQAQNSPAPASSQLGARQNDRAALPRSSGCRRFRSIRRRVSLALRSAQSSSWAPTGSCAQQDRSAETKRGRKARAPY